MGLIVVLAVCFTIIGIGFWQIARKKAADRASHWLGAIEKLDETDGLHLPLRTGGTRQIQAGRHVIWVYFRRDDGTEGAFFVGSPGNWQGWKEEPGKPDYEAVKQHWKPKDRLEKPAGEPFPRRVEPT